MKKIILSSISTLIITTSANAFIGLDAEVGGGVWIPKLSGYANINYTGQTNFDNNNFNDKIISNNNYLYADFNHIVPLIPNIRVEKLAYNIQNKTTTTKVDMKQTDLVAYWEMPFVKLLTADVLNLNFGIDAKNLKGVIDTNQNGSSHINFNKTIPLIYLNAKANLPFVPFDIEATSKAISYKGANISDNAIKISIDLPISNSLVDFKLDIGYRAQDITIADNFVTNLNTKVDTKGGFFGISAKF